MRIAVVVSPKNGESRTILETAKDVTVTLERRGYSVECINTLLDSDKKLTIFDYLVFIGESVSLFSKKVSPSLGKYLNTCGTISGKRAAVILAGRTLLKTGAMAALMKAVEGEGVILKTSEFCNTPSKASAFVNNINVERNY